MSVLAVFVALAALLSLVGPPDSPLDSYPVNSEFRRLSHHTGRRFLNPWPDQYEHGIKDMLRWHRSRKVRQRPRFRDVVNTLPLAPPQWTAMQAPGDSLVVTWIGHATCLVQMNGLNILTDPIFSERCSPVQSAGPRRVTPLPLDPAKLPPIDLVIISHNHYDHLDQITARLLANDHSPTWLVPLGLKAWFSKQGISRVVELDWWDRVDLSSGEAVCVPAKHFASRTPWDHNKTLWASWVILSGKHRIYFSGDTGYGEHLATIGNRYGPFDLALLPIGSYQPEWFMLPVHMNPQQAVQAHADLHAGKSLGIHWGTFILSDEPVQEPPRLFVESARQAGLTEDEIIILQHGQTLVLP